MRPGLRSEWGRPGGTDWPRLAQLGGCAREPVGLEGLTGRDLQRANQEGFLEVLLVGCSDQVEGKVKRPEVMTGAEQRAFSPLSSHSLLGEALPSCRGLDSLGAVVLCMWFKGWTTFWELKLTSDLSHWQGICP